jgi:hypothetical protein
VDSEVHRKDIFAHGFSSEDPGVWMVPLVPLQQAVFLHVRERVLRVTPLHKRSPEPSCWNPRRVLRDGCRRFRPLVVSRQQVAVQFQGRCSVCWTVKADQVVRNVARAPDCWRERTARPLLFGVKGALVLERAINGCVDEALLDKDSFLIVLEEEEFAAPPQLLWGVFKEKSQGFLQLDSGGRVL